jgi:hypothetical protein
LDIFSLPTYLNHSAIQAIWFIYPTLLQLPYDSIERSATGFPTSESGVHSKPQNFPLFTHFSYQISILMSFNRPRIPQLLKSCWPSLQPAKMATTAQAALNIISTVRMNSGYEMPILGYGVRLSLKFKH